MWCHTGSIVHCIQFINSIRIYREFYIINPTDMDLNFIWTREDPSDSGPANFTCTPKTGLIESGKKIHMRFEYISNNLDLTESFWRFFIQEHNISLPFLLVGHTTEPVVSLDRSHFNFREILIGKMSSLLSLRVWVHITFCRADLRFFLYYHFKTCFKRLLNNILTRQILRRISTE